MLTFFWFLYCSRFKYRCAKI